MTPPGFVVSDTEVDRRWQSAKGLPTEGDFPAPSSASASASVAPFHNVVQPAIGSSVPGSGGRSRRPLAMGAIQEATTSNSRGGVNNRRPLSADAAARPPQPGDAGAEGCSRWMRRDTDGGEVLRLDETADGEEAPTAPLGSKPPKSMSQRGEAAGGPSGA
eukprot:CAMPEP_0177796568 /NCGR_PEP_ID=MMETSP0491_2-20121128/26846_1 /TAXON_ID=63592 /ORGANISM="Tetraselmis chuii, Strain PLY429" /LENGTH=160 /DNA_ID=CAMNT_0019319495 /DNA_START=296 /DNA_END=775 /DNA_ORIENTATION=-